MLAIPESTGPRPSFLLPNMSSPYFTPSRKRRLSTSPSPSSRHAKKLRQQHTINLSSADSDVDMDTDMDLDVDWLPTPHLRSSDSLLQQQQQQQDPLFCFYFRSFSRLYRRLDLAKPCLIQGKSLSLSRSQKNSLSLARARRRRPMESLGSSNSSQQNIR